MPDTKSDVPRPLVLVVDDNPQALEIAADAFTDEHCAVIQVTEPEEAIRQLRASPGVNLLYTDVKLREKPGDISGIFLGDFVKAEQPDVPVAIYSINFRPDELNSRLQTDADTDFDLVLPRGGTEAVDFAAQIAKCAALAAENRDRRYRDVHPRANVAADEPYWVVRELTIGSSEPSQAEEILRDNGYSLRILSLSINDDRFQSLTTWLLKFGNIYSAELYEAPRFHATGSTPDEALNALVSLVRDAPSGQLKTDAGEEAISRLLLSLGNGTTEK